MFYDVFLPKLYKSITQSCMEYYYPAWAGAPSCSLDMQGVTNWIYNMQIHANKFAVYVNRFWKAYKVLYTNIINFTFFCLR